MTKATPKRKQKFLQILRNGGSVSQAATEIGVARQNVYEWRAKDIAFQSAWDDAVEYGTDIIEDEAKRRAVEGWDEPVFYQGDVCGVVRKHSDTLMIFLLKSRRPEKYRENIRIRTWMDDVMDALITGKATLEDVRRELGDNAISELAKSGRLPQLQGVVMAEPNSGNEVITLAERIPQPRDG